MNQKHKFYYDRIKNNSKNYKSSGFYKDEFPDEILDLEKDGYIKRVKDEEDIIWFDYVKDKTFPRLKNLNPIKVLKFDGLETTVIPCYRPSFGGKEASWDSVPHKVNEKEVLFRWDSTWGDYLYFDWVGFWYKIYIFDNISEIIIGSFNKEFIAE